MYRRKKNIATPKITITRITQTMRGISDPQITP